MAMRRGRGGVEYEDTTIGKGPVAARGSKVAIRFDLYLHRGEQIRSNESFTLQLGKRSAIAGLEYGIEGMRAGGERRIRIGPHLAYGGSALPGIPAGALLEFHVTLESVDAKREKAGPCGYLRFVVHWKDEDSGRRQGLFHALAWLRDEGRLSSGESVAHEQVRAWFNQHLETPTSFARSSRSHAKNVAIGWFKDTAVEHISRMYEMARILEAHDVAVEVIRTDKPGYIVYDDEFQVAAEPFVETPT